MAFHDYVQVAAGDVPTLVTAEDVTAITLQNTLSGDLKVFGTVGAVAPDPADVGLVLVPGGVILGEALTDLFPGVAATRIYVWGFTLSGRVVVSHG